MDETRIELETQRLLNLVRGFGWERIEQKVTDEGISIVLRLKLPTAVPLGGR